MGDLAETVSLIWPNTAPYKEKLPSIAEFISKMEGTPKAKLSALISSFLDNANSNERWAMIKFATGGLRVGVSARLAKTALAAYSGCLLEDIEKVWHGLTPPYISLFEWLDGKTWLMVLSSTMSASVLIIMIQRVIPGILPKQQNTSETTSREAQ